MTEENKKSGGAGKFFLGAAIGAALGAIAGRFIKVNSSKEEDDGYDCEGECEHCKAKDEKIAKLEEANKKSRAKETESKKSTSKK